MYLSSDVFELWLLQSILYSNEMTCVCCLWDDSLSIMSAAPSCELSALLLCLCVYMS